ncbi:alpha/beta hydrolase [Phycisphaerales bacterium AB-hyl4]|uniref:Alpha/beta hydrolase n=1 Tax=Natronomicrosphaera hydrolytica TaxID=3242702 RepID=A0ABV4U8R6_9BACT
MADADAPSTRYRPHWGIRMLTWLLIALLVWTAAVWLLQRQALFPRHVANMAPAIDRPSDAEVLRLDTSAGEVVAWLLPGEGVSADRPGPAVMFAHGNGERIDFWPAALQRYRDMGVTVMLPSYRGYGPSAGRPSARAILDDFTRFHDKLAARDDVDADRIIFHGRSLGGATLGTLAGTRPPAGLILESTFTSTAAMARSYLVPPFLIRDRFDALTPLRNHAGPVLIMHGRLDTIVPSRHAEHLHAAAADSELVWFETTHNDPMPEREYWQAIESYLQEHDLLTAEPTEPG